MALEELTPQEDLVLRIIAVANEWGLNPTTKQIEVAVNILTAQKLEKEAKFE